MKNGFFVFAILLFCSMKVFSSSISPSCSQKPNALPNPAMPAGANNKKIPIEHIIVIMQENHSFDNYLGQLNSPKYYGSQVDGVIPSMSNPDKKGSPVLVYHENNLCLPDPHHDWNSMHNDWNKGANDGFVNVNKKNFVMGYYDENDLPFYYELANQFAIGDRYFSSTLSQTFPNRFFLLTASAFGHVKNDSPAANQFSQKTIFDVLNTYGITWKYYSDGPGYLELFKPLYNKNKQKKVSVAEFSNDAIADQLPQVSFIDSGFEGYDEHPSEDIQNGEKFVADRIRELTASTSWKNSALFLTYDESGGFFDHVAPPAACVPDAIEPNLTSGSVAGRYDRYGFRVPFFAVSPFSKHHFVSHNTYDHTSVLRFIETKFNLPALTSRDANADALLDMFDFTHPNFAVSLPNGEVDQGRLCGN